MMYLIWAYHKMYDVNMTANGTFMKHTAKGAVAYTFIEPGYNMLKINDNYRLYWKYNQSMDMFYFKIVVKTTGWVAFGFANDVGGMKGYDVMVGGVNGGKGYIGVRHLKRMHVYAAPYTSNGCLLEVLLIVSKETCFCS